MATKKKKNGKDETVLEGEVIGEEMPEVEETAASSSAEEIREEGMAETDTAESRIAALEEELGAAQAKVDENLDGWQRALADYANFRKRIEREQSQFKADTKGNILKGYLEIVDDLERALKSRPSEGEGAEWAGGIDLIYRKLQTMLENEGVKPMQAEGQPFDPNLHEAIAQHESEDHESGEIIEVIQQGYMLGERVLRPARVRIAS